MRQRNRSRVGQNVSHRIDILGDHRLDIPRIEQPRQRIVSGIRLGIPHPGIAFNLSPPVFPSGCGIPEELLQLDGAHLGPDALRAPEIGDPALRGDASAAEGHQVAAGADQAGEYFDLGFELSVHDDTTISDQPLIVKQQPPKKSSKTRLCPPSFKCSKFGT